MPTPLRVDFRSVEGGQVRCADVTIVPRRQQFF